MKQLAGMIFLSWMLLSTASANTIRLEFAGTESLWQEQSIGRVELSGTGVVENAGIENAANFLISGSTAVDFGLTFDAGIINPADGSEDTDQVISMNADGLGIVGGGSSGLGKGNNEGYTVSVDFGEAEAVDILQVSKVRLTNINESKTGRIFNLTDGQWLAFNGSGQVDGVLWLDVYSLGITITGPQVDIPLFSLCNDSDTTYRIDGVELVVVKKTPRREIFQETWEGVASNLVYSGGESGSLFSSVDGTDEDWTYSIDSEMDAAIHPVAAFGDSMAIEHLGGNSGSISFSSTLKKPITIRDGVPVTLKAHFAWNELGANAFRDNEWRLLNDTGAGGYVLRATGETDKDYVFRFVVDHLDVSTDVTVGTPGSQVVGHDYGVEVTFTPNGADTDVSWTITDNGALWDSGSGTVAGTALTGLSMREVNWYSRPNCRCAVDSLCVEEGLSGSRRAYCNPLDLRIGDPRIMRTENANADYLYYLSGTGRRRVVSDDAVNWEEKGVWMPTSDGGQTIDNTWGTEIHEKDGHFYVYFAAYVDGDTSKRQICVSEAGDPDATFSKLAWPIFSSSHKWIGPNVFTDTDGTSYLYATDDSKELNGGEASIWVARLKPNMYELDTSPVFCVEPTQSWESEWCEGVCVIKHEETYYLTYSSRFYGSDAYEIGCAVADSPMGPFTKVDYNPILKQEGTDPIYYGHTGPGSHGFFTSPDHSELFIAYHTHVSSLYGGPRQLNIDRVQFIDNGTGPDRLFIDGPTLTEQPYPSGSPATPAAVNDEFNEGRINYDIWKNVYNQSTNKFDLLDGQLRIQMQPDDLIGSNNTGGNIFLQAAPEGDYEITTHLSADCNANYLQAFLVVWQDPNNYVMCKTAYDNGAVFVASKEVNETVTKTATPNTIGADVYLKIEKTGQNYGCCYSADGTNWIQIGSDIAFDINEEKVGFGGWKASPDLVGIWRANFDWFHINGASAARNAYEAWAAAYNLEGSNAWSWIDLEPDGMNNLLEYALGGNPTNADAATVLPSGEMVPILGTNWLELVYLRRHDYAARGLTYTVKAATSLTPGQWSTNGVAPGGSEPFDEEFDTVTDRISTENEPAGFLRLEVRQN